MTARNAERLDILWRSVTAIVAVLGSGAAIYVASVVVTIPSDIRVIGLRLDQVEKSIESEIGQQSDTIKALDARVSRIEYRGGR